MKYGLVLEGGSRKVLYSAGVLDVFLTEKIDFDYVVGVSAGGHAAVNFVAGQRGRLRNILLPRMYWEDPLAFFKMGWKEELRRMCYDLPYVKFPFRYRDFFASNVDWEICASSARTGKPVYFTEHRDQGRLNDILNASCSVPLVFPVGNIDGQPYVDGCVTDSIPIQRAFDRGCDKLVVILSKEPGNKPTNFSKYKRLYSARFQRPYPELYKSLMVRYEQYMDQIEQIRRLEKEGKIFVFKPMENICGVFDTSKKRLDFTYNLGINDAQKRLDELREFMSD